METNSLIGQPIDRTDGRLKVTGGARYSAEINLPGLVYGVIIPSTVSKGAVLSMDTAAAEQAPGVVAVLTPFNMPKLPKQPEPKGGVRPSSRKISLLQDATVHYELQPIGVVVADTLERAMHGASLVQVKYDEQPPVAGLVTHLEDAYAPQTGRRQPPGGHGHRREGRRRPVRRLPHQARPGLPDPHREPQRDGAARDHRLVDRSPAFDAL